MKTLDEIEAIAMRDDWHLNLNSADILRLVEFVRRQAEEIKLRQEIEKRYEKMVSAINNSRVGY